MRISVINDEVNNNIEELIKILKKESCSNIEIRKIDNKYLFEIDFDELEDKAKLFKDNNIKVTMIDSPIGKHKFTYEQERIIFYDYIYICQIFDCHYLRIFSDVGEDIEKTLKRYNSIAKINNITLLIENERNTLGDNYKYLKELMNNNYSNIKILYDIENYYHAGVDYKEAYKELKEYIKYIHVRDYSKDKEKYVDLFTGDIDLDFIFKDKKIIISLETHLAMNKDSNVLDKEKYFVDNIRRIKEYDV